jgi:hypothetical protein
LDLLHSVQHRGWKYTATFDDAGFHFSNQYEQIWLPDHEDPPTIERQTISSPTTILTVVWNPYGFHLVKILPRGQKWTIQYYIDCVLLEIRSLHGVGDQRRLVVHIDDAKPHVAKR